MSNIIAQTGTLKKINDTGVITLGHRESVIPFSYYDQIQQVVGYSHDFQMKIVDAIKKVLNRPDLQVRNIAVTLQNRIPLVQNGTVDIECGSTTHNLEREKQVAFSNTIFLIGTRLMTSKNSSIRDFADLNGKNVVTTAGTTSERLLRAMNTEKQMGLNVLSAKDHGGSFQMLELGRAVAFMMDDALLAGMRSQAKQPGNWVIVGTQQSQEAYGCMFRRDDPEFKQVVDDAIAQVGKSGEAAKCYSKWFENPIPPKGLTLNFPLSDSMKTLYANPNDSALD